MKFALLVCLLIFPVAIAGETFWQCMFNFMPQWIPVGADIDVMQALDSSGSVKEDGFECGKIAAKKVNWWINGLTANGITGDLSGSRSGFIQFASWWDTAIKINLPDHNTVGALNADIESQVFSGGAEVCVITIGNIDNMSLLTQMASIYNHRRCICHTASWKKLKKGMKKAAKLLKPVIKHRRKNRRKQLKQQG